MPNDEKESQVITSDDVGAINAEALVAEANIEASGVQSESADTAAEIAALREALAAKDAENEQLRSFVDEFRGQLNQPPNDSQEAIPEKEEADPTDYDLVSIYVPYNAQGVSKLTGFDPDTGETYNYTTVKVGHTTPDGVYRNETFNIRLDARVVVPRFVANILGDRCDVQDYVEP